MDSFGPGMYKVIQDTCTEPGERRTGSLVSSGLKILKMRTRVEITKIEFSEGRYLKGQLKDESWVVLHKVQNSNFYLRSKGHATVIILHLFPNFILFGLISSSVRKKKIMGFHSHYTCL